MLVKGIITEDFVNYKEPCMTIEFPYCDFKCDRENGNQLCHNYALQSEPDLDISFDGIVNLYLRNTITKAIVFQGLEPFFNKNVLYELIEHFRKSTNDTIVIYTGYTEKELQEDLELLKKYDNIIVKFGRYRPNQEPHYDEVLGVMLANDEQYAKEIS